MTLRLRRAAQRPPGRSGPLLIAFIVLLSACSGSAPTESRASGKILGLAYSSYAHEDEPFAEDLFAEHARIPQESDRDIFYVAADSSGTYTHVTDLERRSWSSGRTGPSIWFFGGSTLFGIGQRDEHTIPSEIARLADATGTPVEVHNFGFPAYAAWQEVGLLRKVLADRPPPDLIVFLHGVNDYSQLCRRLAAGTDPLARTDLLQDPPLGSRPPKVRCTEDAQATARLLVQVVNAAMDEVPPLAGAIPVVEFWQPYAAARAAHPSDGPLLERLSETRASFDASKAPYLEVLGLDPTPPIDLTDALDDEDRPTFFDYAHTNELGARLVAQAMWDRSLRLEVADLSSAD